MSITIWEQNIKIYLGIKMIFISILIVNMIVLAHGQMCMNRGSTYGWDLHDIDNNCTVSRWCYAPIDEPYAGQCLAKVATGDVIPVQYDDEMVAGVATPIDPRIVCASGKMDTDGRCTDGEKYERCTTGPDPCRVNYCLGPRGGTYNPLSSEKLCRSNCFDKTDGTWVPRLNNISYEGLFDFNVVPIEEGDDPSVCHWTAPGKVVFGPCNGCTPICLESSSRYVKNLFGRAVDNVAQCQAAAIQMGEIRTGTEPQNVIETCPEGSKEVYDTFIHHHWDEVDQGVRQNYNVSAYWPADVVANAQSVFSSFGPCGKYGRCMAVPNSDMTVLEQTKLDAWGFNNIITCTCTRGDNGYFCQNDACGPTDNPFCKNGGKCSVVSKRPQCQCQLGTHGPDCSMVNGNIVDKAPIQWIEEYKDFSQWGEYKCPFGWKVSAGPSWTVIQPSESNCPNSAGPWDLFEDGFRGVCKNDDDVEDNWICTKDADTPTAVALNNGEWVPIINNFMYYWKFNEIDLEQEWYLKVHDEGTEAARQDKLFVCIGTKKGCEKSYDRSEEDTSSRLVVSQPKLGFFKYYDFPEALQMLIAGTRNQRDHLRQEEIHFYQNASEHLKDLNESWATLDNTSAAGEGQPCNYIGHVIEHTGTFHQCCHKTICAASESNASIQLCSVVTGITERKWRLATSWIVGVDTVWQYRPEEDVPEACKPTVFEQRCCGDQVGLVINRDTGILYTGDVTSTIGKYECLQTSPPTDLVGYGPPCPANAINKGEKWGPKDVNGSFVTCYESYTTSKCDPNWDCCQKKETSGADTYREDHRRAGECIYGCCDPKWGTMREYQVPDDDGVYKGTRPVKQELHCPNNMYWNPVQQAATLPANINYTLGLGENYIDLTNGNHSNLNSWSHKMVMRKEIAEATMTVAEFNSQLGGFLSDYTQTFLEWEFGLYHEDGDEEIVLFFGVNWVLDLLMRALYAIPGTEGPGIADGLTSAWEIIEDVLFFFLPIKVRDLTFKIRITFNVQSAKLTFRLPFELGEGCLENPDLMCLVGELIQLSGGDRTEVQRVINGLEYELEIRHEAYMEKWMLPRLTVRMSVPLILKEDDNIYIAMEDPDGNGPEVFFVKGSIHPKGALVDDGVEFEGTLGEDFSKDALGKPITPKLYTMYGARIPFHLRIGKDTDIFVIGKLTKATAVAAVPVDPTETPPVVNPHPTLTYSVHVPSWIHFDWLTIPIHVQDAQIRFVQQKPGGEDLGHKTLQLAGTVCIGKKDSCVYKKCNYLQGSFFMFQDQNIPTNYMRAVMLDDLTMETLMFTMCDSQWFGMCADPVVKAITMAGLSELPGWFLDTGLTGITPKCAEDAENTEQCCTREDLIDITKGFKKKCFAYMSMSPELAFTVPIGDGTIYIEQGYHMMGKLNLFGLEATVDMGFVHRHLNDAAQHIIAGLKKCTICDSLVRGKKIWFWDAKIDIAPITIAGFIQLTRAEDDLVNGPFLHSKGPFPPTLTFSAYLGFLIPIGSGNNANLGVRVNGTFMAGNGAQAEAYVNIFDGIHAKMFAKFAMPSVTIVSDGSFGTVLDTAGASERNEAENADKGLEIQPGLLFEVDVEKGLVEVAKIGVRKVRELLSDIVEQAIKALETAAKEVRTKIDGVCDHVEDGVIIGLNELLGFDVEPDLNGHVVPLCKEAMEFAILWVQDHFSDIITRIRTALECVLLAIQSSLDVIPFDVHYMAARFGFHEKYIGYLPTWYFTIDLTIMGTKIPPLNKHTHPDCEYTLCEFPGDVKNGLLFLIETMWEPVKDWITDNHSRRRLSSINTEGTGGFGILQFLTNVVPNVILPALLGVPVAVYNDVFKGIESIINLDVAAGSMQILEAFDIVNRLIDMIPCDKWAQDQDNKTDENAAALEMGEPKIHGSCIWAVQLIYDLTVAGGTPAPLLEQCRFGCGIDGTCNKCVFGERGDGTNHTVCEAGEFCTGLACTEQLGYGGAIGIYSKEACKSQREWGGFCRDCDNDLACWMAAISLKGGNAYFNDIPSSSLVCIDHQCVLETIKEKRHTSEAENFAVGFCLDHRGSIHEQKCWNTTYASRGEEAKFTCSHDCCYDDGGFSNFYDACGSDVMANGNTSLLWNETCKWGCCDENGFNDGWSEDTYCPGSALGESVGSEECCFQCCCHFDGGARPFIDYYSTVAEFKTDEDGNILCDEGRTPMGTDLPNTTDWKCGHHACWASGVICGIWEFDGLNLEGCSLNGENKHYMRGDPLRCNWGCCNDNGNPVDGVAVECGEPSTVTHREGLEEQDFNISSGVTLTATCKHDCCVGTAAGTTALGGVFLSEQPYCHKQLWTDHTKWKDNPEYDATTKQFKNMHWLTGAGVTIYPKCFWGCCDKSDGGIKPYTECNSERTKRDEELPVFNPCGWGCCDEYGGPVPFGGSTEHSLRDFNPITLDGDPVPFGGSMEGASLESIADNRNGGCGWQCVPQGARVQSTQYFCWSGDLAEPQLVESFRSRDKFTQWQACDGQMGEYNQRVTPGMEPLYTCGEWPDTYDKPKVKHVGYQNDFRAGGDWTRLGEGLGASEFIYEYERRECSGSASALSHMENVDNVTQCYGKCNGLAVCREFLYNSDTQRCLVVPSDVRTCVQSGVSTETFKLYSMKHRKFNIECPLQSGVSSGPSYKILASDSIGGDSDGCYHREPVGDILFEDGEKLRELLGDMFSNEPSITFAKKIQNRDDAEYAGSISYVNDLDAQFLTDLRKSAAKCSVGTFQDEIVRYFGSVTQPYKCKSCGGGSYQNEIGQVACKLCPHGWESYSPYKECELLEGCHRGTYVSHIMPNPVLYICQKCSPGYYQDEHTKIQTTQCKRCNEGQYQNSIGSTKCSDQCFRGFRIKGRESCEHCVPGQFSNQDHQHSCKLCPQGYASRSYRMYLLGFGGFRNQGWCEDCPPGKFSTSGTDCKNCPVAKFTDEPRSGECKSCAAGAEQKPNRAGCQQCPYGKIRADGVMHECYTCPPDTTPPITGQQDHCDECELRWHGNDGIYRRFRSHDPSCCANSGLNPCPDTCLPSVCMDKCPPGRYFTSVGNLQPAYGVSGAHLQYAVCDQCPLGKYTGWNSAEECTDCEPGKYQDEYGTLAMHNSKLSCKNCKVGQFFDEYHRGATNEDHCKDCKAGQSGTSMAMTSCTKCARGRYQDNTKQITCTVCPYGQYNIDIGNSNCQKCPEGATTEYDGQITQEYCKMCTSPKQLVWSWPSRPSTDNRCVDQWSGGPRLYCSPGSYQSMPPESDPPSCKLCPTTMYQDEIGRLQCKTCATGKYNDQTGQYQCKSCIPNNYTAAEGGAKSCTYTFPNCPGGMGPRWSECGLCPLGYAALETQEYCPRCEAGTYQDQPGQETCKLCPQGWKKPNKWSSNCMQCPNGEFSMPSRTFCAPCQTGSVHRSSDDTCVCNAGKYRSANRINSRHECLTCPVGKITDQAGQTSCKTCANGQYMTVTRYRNMQNDGLDPSCEPCDSADAVTTDGTDCVCPVGKWNKPWEGSDCKSCPIGQYADETAPTHYQDISDNLCLLCPKGQYQDVSNSQLSCKECGDGKYNDQTSQSSCKHCGTGKYNDQQGQTSCKDDCNAGSHINSDKNACLECNEGHYQDQNDQTSCKPCATGKYNQLKGKVSCRVCPTGRLSDQGADHCKECEAGKTRVGSATICSGCPIGTSTLTSGLGSFDVDSSCVSCAGGQYQDQIEQYSCKQCGTGKYNGLLGQTRQTSCKQCYTGKYNGQQGQSSCTPCGTGKYQDESQQSSCKECGTGKYMDALGKIVCTDCQLGMFTESTGQQACTNCSVGLYSVNGTSCTDTCPGGTGKHAHNACVDCVVGQYSDQQECHKCPPAKYMDSPKGVACKSCSPYSVHGYCSDSVQEVRDWEQYDETLHGPPKKSGDKYCVAMHGLGSCVSCNGGSYSVDGMYCTPVTFLHLGQSKYNDRWGSAGVYGCPLGTGLTDIEGNPPTQFNGVGYKIGVCSTCPIGFYAPSEGGDMLVVPYNGGLDRFNLVRYKGGLGAHWQTTAIRGTYWEPSECLTCPVGRYQDNAGQTSCKQCGAVDVNGAAVPYILGEGHINTGQECFTPDQLREEYTCDIEPAKSSLYRKLLNDNGAMCNTGTYLDGDKCVPCPMSTSRMSFSPQGSTSVDACMCAADMYMDGNLCKECPATASSPQGSTSIDDCVCEFPQYRDGGYCKLCPGVPANTNLQKGFRWDQTATWQYAPLGSTSIDDCLCWPGRNNRQVPVNGQCVSCPPNSTTYFDNEPYIDGPHGCICSREGDAWEDQFVYYRYLEDNQCKKCPKGFKVTRSATSVDDCVPSKACSEGEWPMGTGPIPDGQFDEICQICDVGKSVAAGEAAWRSDCEPCPSGEYASSVTRVGGKCEQCPGGKTSAAGSVFNKDHFLWYNRPVTTGPSLPYPCQCPDGMFDLNTRPWMAGDTKVLNGECTVCDGGIINDEQNFCQCPENKYQETVPWGYWEQISLNIPPAVTGKCKTCPSGSTSAVGSTGRGSCKCPENMYAAKIGPKIDYLHRDTDFECVSCGTGYTNSPAGITRDYDCQCPENTYQYRAQHIALGVVTYSYECRSCFLGATSDFGSKYWSDCVCPENTFRKYEGEYQCSACPTVVVSGNPWKSYSDKGSLLYTDCKCPTNYYMGKILAPQNPVQNNDAWCSICPTGPGMGSDGPLKCKCPFVGQVWSEFIYTDWVFGDFVTDGNSYFEGGWCKAFCPENMFKHRVYVEQCEYCPTNSISAYLSSSFSDCKCNANMYMDSSTETCIACPSGKQSHVGSNDIGDCVCPADKYMDSSTETCIACPSGKQSDVGSNDSGDCVCPADKYMDSTEMCKSCPYDTTSAVGSTSQSDCVCPVDHYLDQQPFNQVQDPREDGCRPCNPSSPHDPSQDATSDGKSELLCRKCSTLSGLSDGCTCSAHDMYRKCSSVLQQRGTYPISWSSTYKKSCTCELCPAGTYMNTDRTGCLACINDSQWITMTSPVGSTSQSACICPENTYMDNGECKYCQSYASGSTSAKGSTSASDCACPANSYMDAGVCKSCPTGSTSAAGSTSCTCPANYYMDAHECKSCPSGSTSAVGSVGSTSCTCPANYYMKTVGCKPCPTGSTSAVGSTSCTCPANYYMDSSTETCQSCPTGSTSAEGSTSASDCACPGTQQLFGGSCACPANSYMDAGVCKDCPSHSKSVAGSTSASYCVCPVDQQLINNNCLCAANHYSTSNWVAPYAGWCKACPSGSTSPAGTVGIGHCMCAQGSILRNDVCIGCTSHNWRDRHGNSCYAYDRADWNYCANGGKGERWWRYWAGGPLYSWESRGCYSGHCPVTVDQACCGCGGGYI